LEEQAAVCALWVNPDLNGEGAGVLRGPGSVGRPTSSPQGGDVTLTCLPCPECDAPLTILNRSTAVCSYCETEWLLTLTDAWHTGKRNRRAPFADLIDMVMDLDGHPAPAKPRRRLGTTVDTTSRTNA
jgi:hypothetical protein